jgi:hypothetical protein
MIDDARNHEREEKLYIAASIPSVDSRYSYR